MLGDDLYSKLLGHLLQQFATPHEAQLASGQSGQATALASAFLKTRSD